MSERALAYSEEPLSHRFLIVFEAVGLSGEWASYLMCSLLSEGRVRYEVVEKRADGQHHTRLIERAGPTGLITTTTLPKLHPENETRLLSVTVTDSPEQTKAVMRTQAARYTHAARGSGEQPDLSEWQALQTWLGHSPRPVVIPFADALSDLIPPVAVRLRRDFPKTLVQDFVNS